MKQRKWSKQIREPQETSSTLNRKIASKSYFNLKQFNTKVVAKLILNQTRPNWTFQQDFQRNYQRFLSEMETESRKAATHRQLSNWFLFPKNRFNLNNSNTKVVATELIMTLKFVTILNQYLNTRKWGKSEAGW